MGQLLPQEANEQTLKNLLKWREGQRRGNLWLSPGSNLTYWPFGKLLIVLA